MKYQGEINIEGNAVISIPFDSTAEAEQWIMEHNINLEFSSAVREIDNSGEVVDWYTFS